MNRLDTPSSPLGRLPEGWRLARLKDLVRKVKSGATPKGGESSYLSKRDKFALIRSQNVFDRRFDEEGLAFISDHQAEDLEGAQVQPNDVLLNITGDGITFARSCLVSDAVLPACVNQHVMLIRTIPELCHPGYLASYIAHPIIKDYIESFNAGGSRRAITKGHIESFVVPVPSLSEQRAIASVLGALDDKIELNRRMNETLEGLAQSLFKSWFVDFDPVRARGGQFQDSMLGEIPKGWKVERFDQHISADRGLSYSGEGLRDDGTGLPMHNLNSVYEGGGYKYEGIKYYDGEYREKHLLNPGDMIVTNTEQGFDHWLIGHAAIVPRRYGPKGLFSHHLYRVRIKPSSPLSPCYLVELFNNPRWHYWISGFSNGTTINMLPVDALQMPLLVVPPDELVKKFTVLSARIHEKLEANLEENLTLAALRDGLLPKLLSGELRVSAEVKRGKDGP